MTLPTTPLNDTALQPLILRREHFGGLIFDPSDGTFLELDRDGYQFARDWLRGERAAATDDEKAFLARLQEEVASVAAGPRACRVFDALPERLPLLRNATVLKAPTLVDLQVTRRCNMGCPQCYASATPKGQHIPYPDAIRVIDEMAAAGVFQVAIGGGEPLLHPQIGALVERIHRNGMVPSMTTTGDGLTPELLDTLARCCGAIALSLEGVGKAYDVRRHVGWMHLMGVLDRLLSRSIRTVLQVTLSAGNFASLPQIVDFCATVPRLYGVIFLAYKAVGRGEGYDLPLSALPVSEVFPKLRAAFLRLSETTRVGYDCCLTPGITGIEAEFGFRELELLDGCSATRSSMGITPELDAVPCTFTVHRSMGNLRERSLMQAWNGQMARAFRNRIDTRTDIEPACQGCASRAGCLGGCPEWNLVGCLTKGAQRQGGAATRGDGEPR